MTFAPPFPLLAGVPEGWAGHLRLPSGGSRPLGPEGWNPPRAHSIICLFCTSTALAVSLSSLSWHAGNSFPARLLATWRATRVGGGHQGRLEDKREYRRQEEGRGRAEL